MNGFRNSSRNGQVWRWQRAGSRAVILEVSGRWMEAAEGRRLAPGLRGRCLLLYPGKVAPEIR
ncbi:hypothetical protein [Escherichia coli]|uniref:hypothetical protein n=1 Tax=Escherichia coli TaxID=562 RepID=UPI001628C065|nr:hypothetical protein [Escherichia coli]